MAAIGGKYNTPETYATTHTENIKQLRVACTCSVFCGRSDNILDWITDELKTSSVLNHMKTCCLIDHLWKKCFQDG
jgi:hypothetical protein